MLNFHNVGMPETQMPEAHHQSLPSQKENGELFFSP